MKIGHCRRIAGSQPLSPLGKLKVAGSQRWTPVRVGENPLLLGGECPLIFRQSIPKLLYLFLGLFGRCRPLRPVGFPKENAPLALLMFGEEAHLFVAPHDSSFIKPDRLGPVARKANNALSTLSPFAGALQYYRPSQVRGLAHSLTQNSPALLQRRYNLLNDRYASNPFRLHPPASMQDHVRTSRWA